MNDPDDPKGMDDPVVRAALVRLVERNGLSRPLTLDLVSVILGTPSGAQNVGTIGAFAVGSYIALAGRRLMRAAGDVLLGWISAEGIEGRKRDFYVRRLWDGKGSAEIETMSPEMMATYAGLCGWRAASEGLLDTPILSMASAEAAWEADSFQSKEGS